MGLSCGNPTATANLRAGELVVDLGSGGGLDVFLAAAKVGSNGKAIGIDMTDEHAGLLAAAFCPLLTKTNFAKARDAFCQASSPDRPILCQVVEHLVEDHKRNRRTKEIVIFGL
jgi:hypothetical protein